MSARDSSRWVDGLCLGCEATRFDALARFLNDEYQVRCCSRTCYEEFLSYYDTNFPRTGLDYWSRERPIRIDKEIVGAGSREIQ